MSAAFLFSGSTMPSAKCAGFSGLKQRAALRRVFRFCEVTMDNPLNALLHSRKFWIAVAALVQTVLFSLVPNFPKEVWMSIDVVLSILIGSIAYEDGQASKERAARLMLANCDDNEA